MATNENREEAGLLRIHTQYKSGIMLFLNWRDLPIWLNLFAQKNETSCVKTKFDDELSFPS